jgi:hypothetical protein
MQRRPNCRSGSRKTGRCSGAGRRCFDSATRRPTCKPSSGRATPAGWQQGVEVPLLPAKGTKPEAQLTNTIKNLNRAVGSKLRFWHDGVHVHWRPYTENTEISPPYTEPTRSLPES